MVGKPVEAMSEVVALRGAVAEQCNAMFGPALSLIEGHSLGDEGFKVRSTLMLRPGVGIAACSDKGEFLGRLWYRRRGNDVWVVHFQTDVDPKAERLVIPKISDSMGVFPRISLHDFDRSPHAGVKVAPGTYEVSLELLRQHYVPSLNRVLAHYGKKEEEFVPIFT